ncbi:proline-rich receptor-like protein kinase PERK10 [Brassica napus]|uniref:proline-rich receptor-like protein kinase PERK10 n=1 Tax=Brassica napus TaxID=3708 RepID=UPI00207A1CFC|nr:proline-rich receptor-like protein kinase PERK10 [Brassica napus]
MQTRWAFPGRASAVQPASSTSGEALLPPPFPPDPPDPLSPLSPHLFPPLDSTPPLTRSQTRRSHLTATHVDTVMTQAQHPTTASAISQATIQFGSLAEIESIFTVPATGNPKTLSSFSTSSPSPSLEKLILPEPNSTNFKILQPNHNSPLLSNSASTSLTPSDHAPPPSPVRSTIPNSQPHTVPPHPNPPPIFQPQPQTHNAAPTLAETLRVRGDKSLQRLAPVTISETGRPRVLIPDSVFHKGAEPNSTNFKILQPNHNSPLLSNSASTSLTPSDHAPPPPPPPVRSTIPNSQPHTVPPHPNPPPIFQPQPQTHNAAPTLAETLRVRGDKSLQRLAPVTISETGRPRVLIPDSVFHKGAELHKDFIICYFNGRPPPPFKQIQSVLCHTVSLPTSPSAFNTPSFVPTPTQKFFPPTAHISPDKPQKPSLKRTRSSPTISPTAPPKIT